MKRAGILFLISLLIPAALDAAGENGKGPFSQKLGVIVLDPGHGGNDPGAVGSFIDDEGIEQPLYEKDLNLAIAEITALLLRDAYPEIRVVMTRTDDTTLTLWNRAHRANQEPVDPGTSKILISLHANAFSNPDVSGFEVWRLKESNSFEFFSSDLPEAMIQAAAEQTNLQLNEELDLCNAFLSAAVLEGLDGTIGEFTSNRGLKESEFYILKYSYFPAVLIETGFITSPEEAARLNDSDYQRRIGKAIVEAISTYRIKLSLF